MIYREAQSKIDEFEEKYNISFRMGFMNIIHRDDRNYCIYMESKIILNTYIIYNEEYYTVNYKEGYYFKEIEEVEAVRLLNRERKMLKFS